MTKENTPDRMDLVPAHLRDEDRNQAQSRLRVLTLDDDTADRMRLIRICRKSGMEFDCAEASGLDELREQLDQCSFDIVFIDHNLGADSGLDALKIVASHEEQASAIPIMVTGANDLKIAVEAMRSGCADYLVKEELTVAALTKSVATAIERRMLYAEIAAGKAMQRQVQDVVKRFMLSCGPDLRGILKNTIHKVRGTKALIRSDERIDPQVLSELTMLERGCLDLTTFVDDVDSVLHRLR